MEPRLIDANDLARYSVVREDGHRYVPWVAIAEVPTAVVRCPDCGKRLEGVYHDAKK